jgi:ABC-type polysaccharide/polyol phosphate transport system ATPase subunit
MKTTNIKALQNISFRKERRDISHSWKNRFWKSTILALISRLYDVTEGKSQLTIRRSVH